MMKGIVEPDLVFYLRPNQVEAMTDRAEFGNERYESLHIQAQVTKNFDIIFEGKENVHRIDSTKGIEAIAEQIASIVSIKLIGRS
jgi:thymidylate kinase